MRKNIARVLLYTACAVLVVFYILVLWWGRILRLEQNTECTI